jgi:hypothetical protein
MAIKDCLSKLKVGDEVFISRKSPTYRDYSGVFSTTVVGFNGTNQPVIGSNVERGLNGDRLSGLDSIAKQFLTFSSLSESRFKIVKIVKKNFKNEGSINI